MGFALSDELWGRHFVLLHVSFVSLSRRKPLRDSGHTISPANAGHSFRRSKCRRRRFVAIAPTLRTNIIVRSVPTGDATLYHHFFDRCTHSCGYRTKPNKISISARKHDRTMPRIPL